MTTTVVAGINIGAGFCNRLFQMVFAYSFSKKHAVRFRFENWNIPSHHSPQTFGWLVERFMALENYQKEPVTYSREYHEPGDRFTEYREIEKPLESTRFCGYFQNEQYFMKYRKEVLELLREPEWVTERLRKGGGSVMETILENAYFLHIRLGDYIQHPKHWVPLEQYYLKVLKELEGTGAGFVIFSNQIQLIDRVYPRLAMYLRGVHHWIIDEPDEVVSFYMMARCKLGGICANSTFGWWAGWLNNSPTKKIFMPDRWMGAKEYNDAISIYPEGALIRSVDEE